MSGPSRPRRDAGRPRGAPVVDAVLTSTVDELAEVGLEGLSIERVARRAGVNKSSVYRRWPTREALVAAALERAIGRVGGIPDTGSLRGDLLELAAGVAEFLGTHPGRALVRAALSESVAPAVAAIATRRLVDRATSPAQALETNARARGEWRDDVDVDQVVFVLVGAVIHRTMLERGASDARWLADLVDLVLLGVTPRGLPPGERAGAD